ncbi:hypothetical protein SAMN05216567_101312 [Variovorax sp. OK605]|jgi:hypothetical protein|uniref:hypothetical protein n=1 Tax=Variovorax sp. OK605 TaxID=1855317 RepID=UPI0008EC785B|nr:hypothetical protein [Variovorax sp. OK605]SFO55530.1 hypothetical protein SAMN05216567_101312 [Variovorax sp. OK605]
MAAKTIARRRTPVPPNAGGPSHTNADGVSDLSDRLEDKITQLTALLWSSHGDGTRWGETEALRYIDRVFWLSWQMADEIEALFQQCTAEWQARLEALKPR